MQWLRWLNRYQPSPEQLQRAVTAVLDRPVRSQDLLHLSAAVAYLCDQCPDTMASELAEALSHIEFCSALARELSAWRGTLPSTSAGSSEQTIVSPPTSSTVFDLDDLRIYLLNNFRFTFQPYQLCNSLAKALQRGM